jgi:hypothetical protein
MTRRIGTLVVAALALAACSTGGAPRHAASTTVTSSAGTSTTAASSAAACQPATTAPGGNGAKEVADPGDIPDNQAYVPYTPPSGEIVVKVPEGWARSDSAGSVTFTDKFNSVRVEVVPSPAAPTVASATATDLPAVRAASRCFEPGQVTEVQRKGGPAVLLTYRVDAAADPVTGKVVRQAVERYEFFHGGKEAILTLAGAVGADNVDPWRIVSDSLTWR